MTLFGVLLTSLYVPGFTGAAVITGWIVLSCLLPFFLVRKIEMGLGHWLGLIFLTYATLSLLWAPVWQQGVWDLWLIYMLAFGFCLGSDVEWVEAGGCAPPIGVNKDHLPKLWIGMSIGLIVPLGFAVSQMLGYDLVFAHNIHPSTFRFAYAGTYVNPDMLGETACLLTIALIASGVYWPLILTLPLIFITQSRNVFVALAVVITFAAWQRWRWAAVIPCLAGLLLVGYWVTSNHKGSIAERFALWQDTAEGITVTGYGAGSFYMLYPKFAKRTDTMATRPEDPHNEYLNLAFEYGIGAIPILALLALGFAAGSPATGVSGDYRYVLLAFLSIAFFSFPTRIPTEGFVGMVALGHLCRGRTLSWAIDRGRRSLDVARAMAPGRAVVAVE